MFGKTRRIPRYDDPRESRWGVVGFDREKCSGCTLCVRICPSDVLVMSGGKARMQDEGLVQCMACGDCTAICPDGAITLERSYGFSGAYQTLDRGELEPPRL